MVGERHGERSPTSVEFRCDAVREEMHLVWMLSEKSLSQLISSCFVEAFILRFMHLFSSNNCIEA
jgi:hypothetical protein